MFAVSGITYLVKIRPRVSQKAIKEQW